MHTRSNANESGGQLGQCAMMVYSRLHLSEEIGDRGIAGCIKFEAGNIQERLDALRPQTRFSFENAVEVLAAVGVWLSEHREMIA